MYKEAEHEDRLLLHVKGGVADRESRTRVVRPPGLAFYCTLATVVLRRLSYRNGSRLNI